MKPTVRRAIDWGRCVILGFLRNNCPIHAAGLTYFAILGVVPVLCCMLVTAKVCGVDHYARAKINEHIDAMISNIESGAADDTLALLAPKSEEEKEKKRIAAEEFAREARLVFNEMFERISQFDVRTFGWIGFGLLLWTVISTLASVETSFNGVFGVAKNRPIWKRLYMYPLLIIVLPVFATVAMSLPILGVVKNAIVATVGATWLTKWVSDGIVWFIDSNAFRLTFTFATASLTFGFFLWVMPNCKVNFRHALYGGAITAVLFGGWMKLCAIAQVGIAKSSALYGSFALMPILLTWNYISWKIILLGANMVHAFGSRDAKELPR